MLLGQGNRFNWWASNASAPVAQAAGIGTSVPAPVSINTLSSTVQVMSALAEDAYGILIYPNAAALSGVNTSGLVNIRVDPAGGTSWTDLIPNLAIGLAGFAGHATAGMHGGRSYYFPVFIKAGSTIGANHQNNRTNAPLNLWVTVFGKPSRPEMVRTGSYVTAFGANTTTSTGTAMTAGLSGAEGASWTQLGSNTTRDFWWWQLGAGYFDGTLSSYGGMFDLSAGDVTNKDLIIENHLVLGSGQESITAFNQINNCYREVPSGVGLYSRVSVGTATAIDMDIPNAIAYGVGG